MIKSHDAKKLFTIDLLTELRDSLLALSRLSQSGKPCWCNLCSRDWMKCEGKEICIVGARAVQRIDEQLAKEKGCERETDPS
jgi:hypothetical protein